jgi:hypothetical protein
MPAPGHETALAALTSEMGGGGAHTPGSPENSQLSDLFRELDDEIADFTGHAIAPPRRPGRPRGSPNRTTQQVKAWLIQRGYRMPAEFLAALYTKDTRELAAELKGCARELVTFEEAEAVAKLQKGAAAELMPYFEQRMPQQVEQVGDAARPLILIMQANQGVNARVIEGSHGEGSHEPDQASDVSRES